MKVNTPDHVRIWHPSVVRFFTECVLVFFFWFFFWFGIHISAIQHHLTLGGKVFDTPSINAIWTPFAIYSGVGFVLLGMIYYGTSFQLTPFRILASLSLALPGVKSALRLIGQEDLAAQIDAGGLSLVVHSGPQPTAESTAPPTLSGVSVDEILRDAASSSEQLADKMERRINLHLMFGVLTGGVGLAVWYVTFYRTVSARPAGVSIADHLLDTLPRLTILFFIELLAGFFLRQYRIGVEDLKYFLELKRRADAKRIAYSIFERVNKTDAKVEFAKQLLNERSDTRLASGEMTTTLYAIDKEKNEFIQGIEAVGRKLEAALKEVKELKEGKSEKKKADKD